VQHATIVKFLIISVGIFTELSFTYQHIHMQSLDVIHFSMQNAKMNNNISDVSCSIIIQLFRPT